MSACAARWSYAHRGRKPDAGRPRGSNWDTTKLLAASGKLGACRPLPLSGLTVAESESTSGSESLGTRKIRHVPPGPPVPGGILLPPMGSMGHRPRLGPQLLPRPSPRRNGDRAPKRAQNCAQVGQSVHMLKMAKPLPKRMEIKGQRRESLNSPCSLPWQPSRPWSSCPSSRSWPWPTLRTRLVRLVGQSHRRPARPTLTVHRGYAAPRGTQCGDLGACFDFRADSRSCSFSGARRRNGAPNQDARREWHRTSNQGAHRRYGEADAGITPTRSAVHASPTTPWPPQRPPSRRTAASLLPCAAGAIRCALAGASCRHREAHSRTTDASAACSRHDSCTCSRHDGRHECATKSPRGGLEAAGGGEQRQRKQGWCATRDSARSVERQ